MIIGKQSVLWKEKPSNEEVEKCIKQFFLFLQQGKLDAARDCIGHKYNDWESQIWSLWEDTYLITIEDEEYYDDIDTSFEGNVWKKDLGWLQKLEIGNYFEADDPFYTVYISYDGEETDVSGDFEVIETENGFCLVRAIIHMK